MDFQYIYLIVIVAFCSEISGQLYPNRSIELHAIDGYISVNIYNGTDAEINDYPWQAALLYKSGDYWYFICGGSLISNRHVLTAAHCVDGDVNAPGRFGILLNTAVLSLNGKIDVEKITMSEFYDSSEFHSDWAVITMSKDVQLGVGVNTIPLAETYEELNNCVITGWGTAQRDGPIHTTLQKGVVDIMPWLQCRQLWGNWITDDMTCAGSGSVGVCSGDSGGPLACYDVRQDRLVLHGITSWGPVPCGADGLPDGYARVSVFRDVIMDVVNEQTTTEAPITTPIVSTAAPTTTPVAATAAPTTTPVAATAAPTTTPDAATAAPTTTPVAATAAPTTTPVAATAAPTTTPVAATAAPTTTPDAATAAPTTTPVAATTAPTTTPVAGTVVPDGGGNNEKGRGKGHGRGGKEKKQ
ncbi:chymotrypsin-like protease CTRL-1 [Saccoglossus kowalevskii]|uniref:Transmembrane protease serine 9-like n=1 Tax=Saccoglossus kowalevskii TaxID=10224 RepID=A0A1C9TA87_SACKO|nr:PREDICTED: transmembrane protease serine 9-like [Saccoglossus kowalevskii]AOR07036.1 trypsin-like protein serine protease-like protein [Saccoglossus kowalevskii]